VKTVLRLEEVRRKREERHDRYVRPLDRKRDVLAAEVDRRMRALIGTQQAEARRILGAINGSGTFMYRQREAGMRDRVIRIEKHATIVEAHSIIGTSRMAGRSATRSSSPRMTRAARGVGRRTPGEASIATATLSRRAASWSEGGPATSAVGANSAPLFLDGGRQLRRGERSRILDIDGQMLSRLWRRGHQAHPLRRLEAVPRPLGTTIIPALTA
jgi:hypothetical protein